MDVSRRKFFKICAGGMAGTTAAALGFAPKMALAQARNFQIAACERDPQHLHLLLRGLRAINV